MSSIRNIDAIVHHGQGPYSGNLRIVCFAGRWFQPKWGEGNDKTIDPEIYVANNDHLYSKLTEKVTCVDCIEKVPK